MSKRQNKAIANSSRRVPAVTKTEVTAQRTSFSGPIPHPEILKGYNEIIPGAAERVLVMAENEAKHQREMEATALRTARAEVRLGQWLGFGIGIAVLGTSIAALFLGSPWVAGILGGTTIVGLVSVFVIGRLRKP